MPKKPKPPNLRRAAFIAAYLSNGANATNAAIAAGYSKRSASTQGERLLRNDEVQAAIQTVTEKLGVTEERALEQAAWLAFHDPRCLFDEKGDPIPVHKLSAQAAAAISGFEIVMKNAKGGDRKMDYVLKYRLAPKAPILELLFRNLGLLEADNRQQPAPGPVFILPHGTAVAIK